MQAIDPPAPDEIEVSIFGPGIGECVVIHLGEGDWIVVDSCLVDRVAKKPVALTYLQGLGIEVEKAIKLIVVSHWHDDHIKGIANLFQGATSSKIACSIALRSEEFLNITAATPYIMADSPGMSEIEEIFDILSERKTSNERPATVGPEWAISNRRLLNLNEAGRLCSAKVSSLSPTSGTLSHSFSKLLQEFIQPNQPIRAIPSQSPNEIAVALWVEVGDVCILLGADLEESGRPNEGWTAIVKSSERPVGRAQVFKVPHHGSPTADSEAVWQEMLVENPVAGLTAYSRGSNPRPSQDDLLRLCSRTSEVYCTGKSEGRKPKKRDWRVEKALRKFRPERRALEGAMGHILVRCKTDGSGLTTRVFSGAFHGCAAA